MFWWRLRAKIGYWLARRLFTQRWAVNHDRLWNWMQGQFSRMAAFKDKDACAFYGHLLLHKGQGMGARAEAMRLLKQAATAGDARSAYQLGVCHLQDTLDQPSDPLKAVQWFETALEHGHPLAVSKLQQLYGPDGPDSTRSEQQAQRVSQLDPLSAG